jgi:hypothetical protein
VHCGPGGVSAAMNARCLKDAEGAPERERDGEGLRGGQEFVIFLEATSATISREQSPNKLSVTPNPPVRGQCYGGHRYQVLRKPHAHTHARTRTVSAFASLSMPPCLPLSLVRPEAVLPDRALCLPTLSHFLIVNKTCLSLALPLPLPLSGQVCRLREEHR